MKKTATMHLLKEQLPGPYVNIRYYVQWRNPDGTVRKSEPEEKAFSYPGFFTAGGRVYTSVSQLCAKKLDEQGHVCRDVYGREVFAEWERFPCFDSYDYLYEHRYYRWFYIRNKDTLTCVYYEDEQKKITVTEDVNKLPRRCWEAMEAQKWQIGE